MPKSTPEQEEKVHSLFEQGKENEAIAGEVVRAKKQVGVRRPKPNSVKSSARDLEVHGNQISGQVPTGDLLEYQGSAKADPVAFSAFRTEQSEDSHIVPSDTLANFAVSEVPPGDEPVLRPDGQAPADIASQTWLLATNHQNMAYMLSAGMLMGPAGFRGKHYQDPSSEFPGWLPLFRGTVPETALEQCVKERKDLRHCIAVVDIEPLRGAVRLVRKGGEIEDGVLPDSIEGDVAAILVPAPLPLSLLKALRFHTEGEQKEFKAVLVNDPTIGSLSLETEVSGGSISMDRLMTWPPLENPVTGVHLKGDDNPVRGQAIGGMLAMLYHVANRSDLCCSAYRVVGGDQNKEHEAAVKRSLIFKELQSWLESGRIAEDAHPQASLYWGVADALLQAQRDPSDPGPIDTILVYLQKRADEEGRDQKLHSALEKLIGEIRSLGGLGRGSKSELFKRHEGALSRSLLLLCLFDTSSDFLAYSNPVFTDDQIALAAILFGIRDGGWRKLPKALRQPDALAKYAMQRMCAIEHGQRLEFISKPALPQPLRELVPPGNWTTSLKEGSFGEFAREQAQFRSPDTEWAADCIETYVTLPSGQHELTISNGGVEFKCRGLWDVPRFQVVKEGFLKKVSQWPPLPPDIEQELRVILKSERG